MKLRLLSALISFFIGIAILASIWRSIGVNDSDTQAELKMDQKNASKIQHSQ